jgi:hypothetical protein
MATYKLIQDIEAEDHILGPLSLRQFIFALVAVACYYICFLLITKHVAFLIILFLPPALFFTFFAVPFGRDQPTEVWALAKLRFLLFPRKRLWNQSGVKELVTITAPKRVERVFTDGLSQGEVRSRLSALANTIDSRGWAVKNVNINAYALPNPVVAQTSDRLIDINSIPQDVPNYDVQASDDILDERNNPIAQQFDQMIQQSNQAHRQQIVSQMNSQVTTQQPQNYWFMQSQPPAGSLPPDQAMFGDSVSQAPGASSMIKAAAASYDDEKLAAELKSKNTKKQVSYGHLRTLEPHKPARQAPTPENKPQDSPAKTQQTPSPATPDPAILPLVSNNDLSVATLAREAARAKGDDQSQGEVVISLR